jgi:hypothetical protein
MKLSQKVLRFILDAFGLIYISIERYVEYPDDDVILGVDMDDDLHQMSRQQLCRYMDAVLPNNGFFELQSTTKIRLGCQLLRNFHLIKKELQENNKK